MLNDGTLYFLDDKRLGRFENVVDEGLTRLFIYDSGLPLLKDV
ncbi:hypothetical protein ACFL51_01530 [Myxococcota bacterium]